MKATEVTQEGFYWNTDPWDGWVVIQAVQEYPGPTGLFFRIPGNEVDQFAGYIQGDVYGPLPPPEHA